MKNKIVVVGSNGYIGKHLTQHLLADNQNEVFLSDIQPSSFFQGVPYLQWDISKKSEEGFSVLYKNCQYVFFLGGMTGTIKSIESYEDFISVNEIGLLHLLNFLKENNRNCKVIFPSTRLVYKGQSDIPLKEDNEKEFKTIYAMNKFSCENYLKIFQQCYGISFTVFRICVPYGNLFNDNISFGTISHFLNQVQKKQNLVVFGDGSQKRTFTHIKDIVTIMAKTYFLPKSENEIFNIGGPDNLSILEIAEKIASLHSLSIEFKEWTQLDKQIESGDTIFSSEKLQSIFPYTYQFNFDSWIKNS